MYLYNSHYKQKALYSFRSGSNSHPEWSARWSDFSIIRNPEFKIGYSLKTYAVLQRTPSTYREYWKKMPGWSCKDYKVHNSSFCPWNLLLMNYSISAESNLCVPSWNTSSWNSHTHSPEENVSKRVDLYVVTSCSHSRALSIGHNPPATHCAKGPWKCTGVEGRKPWSLMYLHVVFRLFSCPQSTVTGLVSFSLTHSLGVDCLYRFTVRINKVRQTIGNGTQQG